LSGTTINIKTKTGGGYTGYLSLPEGSSKSGIILIQEIFGVNSHIKQVADLYAAMGYVVLAPDVFWRAQPGVELGYSGDRMKKGMELAKKSDPQQVIADFADAITALKEQPQFGGKVAAVGYCLGGSYSYQLATRDMVDCAVGYYGGQIAASLEQAKDLHCPLMLHFGAKDTHIPLSDVAKISDALKDKGHVEIYTYDADHGFNCDQRGSYDRQSAMLAFGRSSILLNRVLS
jgi:carboxymethylenebutenolidase